MFEANEEQVETYARKYRPTELATYIGNQRIKETVFNHLKRATDVGDVPHTILLTGTTGCGKTTMARILIKELACENRHPILGACKECHSCVKLENYILTGDTGDLIDVQEIDIASRSGKGDMEELKSEMDELPMEFQYKFQYYDEVHRATESAQDSLLKSLEEPPAHLVMLFATTDPERLKDTIRNRMNLTLKVEKPSTKELVAHLASICKLEGIDYDNEGLRMICMYSGNVIRAALNHLEQVVKNKVDASHEQVSAEFDLVADDLMFEFVKAYQQRDYASYIMHLHEVQEKMSLESFRDSLQHFVTRGIFILNNVNVEGMNSKEILRYKKLFEVFTPAEISVMLANLKKINHGDILANFMAFIYDEGDFHAGVSDLVVKPVPMAAEPSNDGAVANAANARTEEELRVSAEVAFQESRSNAGKQQITDLFQMRKVKED